MRPLAVAVIGCGHLGSIHARKLAGNPEVDLTCVVDPSLENQSRLAKETRATPLSSHREIDEIDAAVVATPTSTHFDVASDLLARGVHLLVEKPLTSTAAEAASLCWLARQHDCVLQVGHVERFNPAFVSARARLREPKYIQARRTSGFTFRSVDIGAVFDLMIHDIDLTLQLSDSPVVKISALGLAMLGKREDMAQARIEFANGCIADLFASRISQERVRCMHVVSPTYSAQLDFSEPSVTFTSSGDEVLGGAFDAEQYSPDERSRMGPDFYKTLFRTEPMACSRFDAIEAEHANFFGAIRREQTSRVDAAAGTLAIEVAEQIVDAIELHKWDGVSTGRVGPRVEPAPQIIRPSQWQTPVERPERKAG